MIDLYMTQKKNVVLGHSFISAVNVQLNSLMFHLEKVPKRPENSTLKVQLHQL